MELRKLLSLLLSATIVVGGLVIPSTALVTSDDYTAEELDCPKYDIRKYTDPFWEGNIVYNEIVHPIRDEDGSTPLFPLMYSASEIVSVKDYTLGVTYKEGVDYSLVDGKLYIIPTGSIHVMNYTDIHPYTAPPGYGADEWMPYYPQADGSGYEYWTGGSDICKYSLAVTYIHNDTWDPPKQESEQHNLPKTFERLKNGESLTIVVAGDSVASGAMASGFLGMSPFADAYPEMAGKALKEKYNNDGIVLINSAIGGTMSYFEQSKMDSTIIQYRPDLVILNFGMNDSSCDRVGIPKAEFKSNNAQQIEYIQRKLPNCEILLLSSLYGNRYTFPAVRYEEHAQALHELAAEYEGVGVADPQRIEKYLIEETGKDYVSFTADNMVHPGDLGMRLSAQCVIEALSFADISEYRNACIDRLTEYAEANNKAQSKVQQLEDYIAEVEENISGLDEEWDISAVIDEAYDGVDFIIKTCEVHEYEHTVVPPTCNSDGYTRSVCVICGYSYDHTPVANEGRQHIMDSGRVTTSATYKSAGIRTYSCVNCAYTETETISVLTNPPFLVEQGMVHINNDHNYIDTTIQPYKNGSGYVEVDICPLSIEKYDGTPYVGLWISNYTITACYNFRTQRVEIINTNLPFSTGTLYASADYEWTSDGGEYKYNWKKFAVQVSGSTVKVYIDGELILQATNSAFQATSEVALLYTNGELYFDNFKVGKGNYDPATGTGGTTLGFWDFNTRSTYNSFMNTVNQSYGTPTFTTPNESNVTTGQYIHTHSGSLVSRIVSNCAHGGYSEYQCSMCGELYRSSFTDSLYGGHTLINERITEEPTSKTDGVRLYDCDTCNMTFTEIIPAGTDLTPDDGDDTVSSIPGDVDGDGNVTLTDLMLLRRYFSGGSPEIHTENTDFNGDGVLNLVDITDLSRYLSTGITQ